MVISKWRLLFVLFGGVSASDLPEEAIAYGWSPDGNSPNFVRRTQKIWDVEEGKGYAKFAYDLTERKDYVDDTLAATSSAISRDLGLDADYFAFSGTLAGASTSLHSSSHHEYVTIFQTLTAQTRVSLDLGGSLRSRMKESIVRFIQESDPEHPEVLVSSLGMFYANKIDLGGIFRAIFQQEQSAHDSNSTFVAGARAHIEGWTEHAAAGGGGTNSERSATGSSHQVHSDFRVFGGHSIIWAALGGDYVTKYNTWLQSLTEDRLAPVHLSLGPIWEVVGAVDPQKAEAVKTYLQQQWRTGQRSLDNLDARPRPIDSCHPLSDHTYRLFVHGWKGGQLNKWLGWYDENYYVAGFESKYLAMPFRFKPADECGAYYLQNMHTESWVSVGGCEWMYGGYSQTDAAPIKFHAYGNQKYTMQNVLPGYGHYFSYTEHARVSSCGLSHNAYSVASGYYEDKAMRVSLHRLQDPQEDSMMV